MSREIETLFEIRSMLILKDTLREMGIDYQELKGDILRIDRDYHDIVINGETGEISYDEENQQEINKIKQTYQTNWYKDNLIRQGNKITEEVTATGEVIIHVG